jgi:hypothetical protein
MANFAEIENDQVQRVIVIADIDCDDLPFPESEPVGQAFIASLGITGTWLQTSYNNNFRGVFAGIDYTFDASLGEYGEFVAPKPDPVIVAPIVKK